MLESQELGFSIVLFMLISLGMGSVMIMLSRKNRKIKILSDQLVKSIEDKNKIEKLGIAISSQEEERNTIARVLHDDIGAILSLAQKNLSNMKENSVQGDRNFEAISLSKEYVSESIERLRHITKGLIPHYLLKFGLVKALEKMTQQKTDSFIDSFNFEANIPDNLVLSDLVMTQYFYIASELITNLLKHSGPTSIEMTLTFNSEHLTMKITHNGIALSQSDFELLAADSDSLGLGNILYRLSLLNGEIIYKKFEKNGTIEINAKV